MRAWTEQEAFWAGPFGDAYVDRNDGPRILAGNLRLFAVALARASGVSSVLELGTNRGLNLVALSRLLPGARLAGVELNAKAAAAARSLGVAEIWQGSLFDYPVEEPADLVLVKGVLIHVAPELLPAAYAKLVEASRRWILLVEYYDPNPTELRYRGHEGKLFKRDFAGELLDRHPELALVDYGFCYHRDPVFPIGDGFWFLLEKRA